MQSADAPIGAEKDRLRAVLIASRRSRDETERQAARTANAGHLLVRLHGLSCIAGYLPLPTEPLDQDLLDRVAATCRVLVPVTLGAMPLDWCEYPGPVTRGSFGIPEPTGPRLGPDAIADADAVLVPALAVDSAGHRLGRGGGHYDRTLALRQRLRGPETRPGTDPGGRPALIAVLFDGEVVDSLPVDGFDQPVTAVVTPGGGVREFR